MEAKRGEDEESITIPASRMKKGITALTGFISTIKDYYDGKEKDRESLTYPNMKYTTWSAAVEKKGKFFLDILPSLIRMSTSTSKVSRDQIVKSLLVTAEDLNNLLIFSSFQHHQRHNSNGSNANHHQGQHFINPLHLQNFNNSAPSSPTLTPDSPTNTNNNNTNNNSSNTFPGNSSANPASQNSNSQQFLTISSLYPKQFRSIREILLSLWEASLGLIERVDDRDFLSTSDHSNGTFGGRDPPEEKLYRLIILIMKRHEFDQRYLYVDVHNLPTCPDYDIDIARKFRMLVYSTQAFVHSRLSATSIAFYRYVHLYCFCIQVLAVNYFRLPKEVGAVLNNVFTPTKEVMDEMSAKFQAEYDLDLEGFVKDYFMGNASTLLKSGSMMSRSVSVNEKPAALLGSASAPSASHQISPSASLSPITSSSSAEEKATHPSLSTQQLQQIKLLHSTYSNLFQWSKFHSALDKHYSASISNTNGSVATAANGVGSGLSNVEIINGGAAPSIIEASGQQQVYMLEKIQEKLLESDNWAQNMKKQNVLYFIFFKEWILYIQSIVNTSNHSNTIHISNTNIQLDWRAIHGYSIFLRHLILEVKASDTLPKTLTDCMLQALTTDISVINVYLKLLFCKTQAYQVMAVLDCLTTIEYWFKFFSTNGLVLRQQTFDCKFFCTALRIIIDTDHHQTLARLLAILYNYATIFETETRFEIYGIFLLDEQFYNLFLHWDDNVRNCFQQILAYKMLRSKRSELKQQGATVKELATANFTKPVTSARKSSVLKREKEIDLAMLQKMECLMNNVEEQLRNSDKKYFEPSLNVYGPRALSEYKTYMSRYYSWEGSGAEVPKLLPLFMVANTD